MIAPCLRSFRILTRHCSIDGNVTRFTMSGKPYFLVIDFEATCWEGESQADQRADQEMIEIGCVVVDKDSTDILNKFSSFVRPVRYPLLSDYCSALTGITQTDVDTAPTFPYALGMMVDQLGNPLDYLFCSWGEFDRYLLRSACRYHRVPYPFDDGHLDLKPLFSEQVSGRNVPMQRALDMLGIPYKGQLHRALDDAQHIALILKEMLA